MTVPFSFSLFPPGNYQGSYVLTPVSGGPTLTGPVGSNVINQIPVGSYTLQVIVDGYASTGQIINASDGSTVVPMTLLNSSSAGLPSGNALNPANNPSTAIATLIPDLNPEFVPPNSEYGRYFMANDARIYIGGVFIDEVDFVQYVLQVNQIPVYPYRSSLFAAMGTGRGLVQGQIAVNFISEGYLFTVLDNYFNSPKLTTKDQDLQDELNRLQAAKNNVAGTFPPLPGSKSVTAANQADLDSINKRISAIVASKGTQGAAALAASIAYASALSNGDKTFCNPVYQAGPFDIIANFTGGGRTVARKIENCFLVSNEQVVSRDGKVLTDVYGFIARRLR